MYRRFLNDNDYLGVITPEALDQITRGNTERMIQAEQSAEMSIVEYLSENYEIEKELNVGKFIAEYDRQISFPSGVHFYLDGQIYQTIRAISGYKAPSPVVYWEESADPDLIEENVPKYSQFKTYRQGEQVSYNNVCFDCTAPNGLGLGNIRIPGVSGWLVRKHSPWLPVHYEPWDVVLFDNAFFTRLPGDGYDETIPPPQSDCWGEIADYDPTYNEYELSDHEYVVCEGMVWYPETDVNSDAPVEQENIIVHDPRNYNLKKHMVRLAVYELTKLIAPNNVSTARIRDHEDSMKWLYDASKLRINPQIPRKVADDRKEVTDWQLATFQAEYDPWKNPWFI